ncbi:MAG: hypothetical protein AAFZ52_14645 [Bacteroidota bacterium]
MKQLLTLFFCLFLLPLSAQSTKGKWYLSGNTSLELAFPYTARRIPASFVRSARIGYALSDRLLVGTDLYAGDQLSESGTNSHYFFRPFARYYFAPASKKLRLFGQVGAFTIGDFAFGSKLETDFHLGGGAEMTVAADIVATGLLRYRARAQGIDYVELALGLNVLVGKRGDALLKLPKKGSWMIDPSLGTLQFGQNGEGSFSQFLGNIRLYGLYYLSNSLALEAGFDLATDQFSFPFTVTPDDTRNTYTTAWIGARKLFNTYRRFQPYLAARFRSDFGHFRQTFTGQGPDFPREVTTTQVYTSLDLGAGVQYFLSDRVVLDGNVFWRKALSGRGEENTSSLRIGLKVALPK